MQSIITIPTGQAFGTHCIPQSFLGIARLTPYGAPNFTGWAFLTRASPVSIGINYHARPTIMASPSEIHIPIRTCQTRFRIRIIINSGCVITPKTFVIALLVKPLAQTVINTIRFYNTGKISRIITPLTRDSFGNPDFTGRTIAMT